MFIIQPSKMPINALKIIKNALDKHIHFENTAKYEYASSVVDGKSIVDIDGINSNSGFSYYDPQLAAEFDDACNEVEQALAKYGCHIEANEGGPARATFDCVLK